MRQLLQRGLRSVRWPEIMLGKLALGFIAISMGVALGQIHIVEVIGLVLLFASLGIFGYGWNDWCDRDGDRLAGRSNAFDRVHPLSAFAVIFGASAAALTIATYLGSGRLVAVLTLTQLLLSFFYSAPLVRLKERGWFGLAAVIAAQYVVPGAILLGAASHPNAADWIFLETIALVDGLTLEVGHQLADRDNDLAAGFQTLAASTTGQLLRNLYHISAVLLGLLFAICPIYLSLRLISMGDAWVWIAWLSPCVFAALLLAARTAAEIIRNRSSWDPFYGEAGSATRLLYSYFPNCFLPLWISIAAAVRHPELWALPIVALVLLAATALANVSVTTGAKHYGVRWHLQSMYSMFAGE